MPIVGPQELDCNAMIDSDVRLTTAPPDCFYKERARGMLGIDNGHKLCNMVRMHVCQQRLIVHTAISNAVALSESAAYHFKNGGWLVVWVGLTPGNLRG